MIARLLALCALSAGLAAPARAMTPDTDHQILLGVLQSHGVNVVINDERCQQGTMLGWTNGSVIGLCADREPSFQSFQNTIRHEAVHVAQRCLAIAAPHTDDDDDGFAVLYPAGQLRFWDRWGDTIRHYYDEADWPVEAEAFGFSHKLGALEIIRLVNTACS